MKLRPIALSTLLFCGITVIAFSQARIQNVEAVQEGDNVIITYDLISDNPDQRFDISVYSSLDNFTFPLQYVRGDLENVSPGTGKQIEWFVVREQGSLASEVTFEVRGEAVGPVTTPTTQPTTTGPPPIQFRRPSGGETFRPGSTLNMQWTGGPPNADMTLELHKNNVIQEDIGETANTGNYNWQIPQDVKGSGFQVKIFDNTNPSGYVMSGQFKIKGKTPVYFYLIPVAVAGGVAAAVLAGNGNGPSECPDATNPNCDNYDPCLSNPDSYDCLDPITSEPPSSP